MKRIFVYGILQMDASAKNFGLEKKQYLGRARLNGYYREALRCIRKSIDKEDFVIGDIFKVTPEKEEELSNFEAQFGYKREITNPIRLDDEQKFETISYIL